MHANFESGFYDLRTATKFSHSSKHFSTPRPPKSQSKRNENPSLRIREKLDPTSDFRKLIEILKVNTSLMGTNTMTSDQS